MVRTPCNCSHDEYPTIDVAYLSIQNQLFGSDYKTTYTFLTYPETRVLQHTLSEHFSKIMRNVNLVVVRRLTLFVRLEDAMPSSKILSKFSRVCGVFGARVLIFFLKTDIRDLCR